MCLMESCVTFNYGFMKIKIKCKQISQGLNVNNKFWSLLFDLTLFTVPPIDKQNDKTSS